jgi:3',5'-cyclic AMP phosphodiesterase CpdA
MKFLIKFVLLITLIGNIYGFKLNMCDNNVQLRKNTKSIDRKIYAKYLIDKRKSEKILKTNTLIRFINDTITDIDNTHEKMVDNIDNISEYNNEDAKIKSILIGNNIHIDVKNVKNIVIKTDNDNIKIELDKSEKKEKKIINEMELLSKNIKELDTLLNLLDIFLTILK